MPLARILTLLAHKEGTPHMWMPYRLDFFFIFCYVAFILVPSIE